MLIFSLLLGTTTTAPFDLFFSVPCSPIKDLKVINETHVPLI
jgi:hypothetical protein